MQMNSKIEIIDIDSQDPEIIEKDVIFSLDLKNVLTF